MASHRPIIDVNASNFVGAFASLNTTHHRPIGYLKCIKHGISVGNSHFSAAFGATQTALQLSALRAAAIRCVLDFSKPKLAVLPEYSRLESTEKMNLSYWIGMTFAGIAASDILGVPRTIHATHLNRRITRANPKSRSLADLVGCDTTNNWHVLEAKGRQSPPTTADRTAWKAQAATIASVNGVPVSTRSYTVGLISSPMSIELVDPPPGSNRSINLQIDHDSMLVKYYRPYQEFLANNAQSVVTNNRTFLVKAIAFDSVAAQYIYVGLEKQFLKANGDVKVIPNSVEEIDDDAVYVGTDGVAVAISDSPCKIEVNSAPRFSRLRGVDLG